MPNIIEQQDLLKGLPDARLAMLLQKPVADIPPFLVAAEAQRRQAIRQQFAGGPQESVVDTLTKQMANVPQNIQAPAQTPQQIPQTPQMQGVMALQQAQQAQQPQQQMNAGGVVRRYYEGGKVEPMWQLPDYSGAIPRVMDWVGGTADWLTTPYANMEAEDKLRAVEKEKESETEPFNPGMTADDRRNSGRQEPGKKATSEENKSKPSTNDVKQPENDEIRSRLEALYADQEPSDWEKAQKWFAMSEQFLDPSKTTMQSIAGAGQAFAGASAEQSRAQREMDLARQKALLEYDAAERDRIRAAESDRATREFETKQKLLERSTLSASGAMDFYSSQINSLLKQLESIDENMMLTPEQKTEAKSRIQSQIDAYNAQATSLMGQSGYGKTVLTLADLEAAAAGR